MISEQTGQSPAWESGSLEPAPEDLDFDESSSTENTNPRLSFETLLEDMCERLQDTKQQGSLKRIHKLEAILDMLERELDELSSAGIHSRST